jgi:hypothetical protein
MQISIRLVLSEAADLPWPTPLKGLKVGISRKMDEFVHEAMAMPKSPALYLASLRHSSNLELRSYPRLAAGQIRLLAFLRNG